ncbi:LLM class flavin-dependent oxidoreductase [Paraburkholderia tropica]|uniref:LLM class flavin-dependent oxidoreductase n=1 Tax=Paraburkholderia tropica TaxID=92647 RepID=UPI002AB638E3|nr:LLM class flavin-dependent oxidoreductase [Paraburkholderia tropica]
MKPPALLLNLAVDPGTSRADPAADWISLARASLAAGCDGLLLPCSPGGEDPWTLAAVLVDALPAARVVVALPVGAMLPVAAAHLAQSLQSISGGRAALACTADWPGGATDVERASMNRDQRLAQGIEFLAILDALWTARSPLDHHGAYFRASAARLPDLYAQRPPLYWYGAEPDLRKLAASGCDGVLRETHATPRLQAEIGRAYRDLDLAAPPPAQRLRRVAAFGHDAPCRPCL